jgi:nitrite reductase/ring-hydroxylating ferredoxin subunit
MDRKQFVIRCASCVGLGSLSLLTSDCAGTKYFPASIEGSDLVIPVNAFADEKDGQITMRKFVVAHNDKLEYPICVYRFSGTEYAALLMRCTHQGTELQVFGDRLQCPAHGSEFSNRGRVQNGPADTSLRTFQVAIANDQIKVDLS